MSGGDGNDNTTGESGRVFQLIPGAGPGPEHGSEADDAEDTEYEVMMRWVGDPWKLASLRLGITVQDIYLELGREYAVGTIAAQLARTVEVWADTAYDRKLLVDLVYRILDAKLGGNPAPKTTT